MIENGKITSKKGKYFVVRVTKNSACDGCRACAFGKNDYVDFKAKSSIDAAVGDTVIVETPSLKPVLPILLLLVLPIVLIVVAALLASVFTTDEIIVAIVAIGVAIASYSALFTLYKLVFAEKYLAEIKSKTE